MCLAVITTNGQAHGRDLETKATQRLTARASNQDLAAAAGASGRRRERLSDDEEEPTQVMATQDQDCTELFVRVADIEQLLAAAGHPARLAGYS